MKIQKLSKRIIKYEFERKEIKDITQAKLKLKEYHSKSKFGTYGGVNTDLLYEKFKSMGHPLEKEEVCPEDDDFIGLRMPNFWPINQGNSSISIAQYYNFVQQKERMKEENFSNWNLSVRKDYGWVGLIEIFDLGNLVKRLKEEDHPFFSVPHTLTECMRFLEGHESKRLKIYEGYAKTILEWAKEQDFYNPSEWFLGKSSSKKVQKSLNRLLNPKLAVKLFWKNQLLNKHYDINDLELDIVSKRFSSNRDPEAILVGQDFLELGGFDIEYDPSKHNLIDLFEKSKDKTKTFPIKKRDPKDNQYKNAKLLEEENPNSKIIMLSYSQDSDKLFQLSNNTLKKEGINLETVLATQAYFSEKRYPDFVKGLEICLR